MAANAQTMPVAKGESSGNNWLVLIQGVVPLIVSIAVLYIFWILVKMMMGMTKVPETEWNRAAYLFAGIEAIAYAAAGFLFGREVHRQRAEQAERRASTEEERATEAVKQSAEVTAKGKALKQVIEAKMTSSLTRSDNMEILESFEKDEPVTARRSDLDELSRIAKELFP
jgi:hypothetical protein